MAAMHVRGARNAGASDEEIAETVLCAIPAAGVAAWMGVGAMLEPVQADAVAEVPDYLRRKVLRTDNL